MPSMTGPASASPDVESVVRRYHRAERAVSWLVVLVVVAAVLAGFRALDPLPAALVAVAVVVIVRVPIVCRGGHTRLAADAEPSTVASEFRSVTPPVLAFQWGIADGIEAGDDEDIGGGSDERSPIRATYRESRREPTASAVGGCQLFGLRSVSLDVEVRSVGTESGALETLQVSGTADGRPWGRYRVSIREGDSRTVVDVEVTTDRRFDLRSVPQTLVAERFFEAALAAQGYRVVDRDVSWSA
ncbi:MULTISPECIES: hypothetical protein [Haloferacaceae]|uniref:Polyketide cyclase / dehydrase and lipid transport n=1 Tax=Halorubrum glutamatedens TaxID=2707018 RepID=A0ABD5QNK4_9EURY|nr:hypothetical protein [Halobellus captivus]